MNDINHIVITGRLTRDPIIKRNGNLMGFFTLASNERRRDAAGTFREQTAFVPCKVFGGWAQELANRKKGDLVILSGRLRTESWNKGTPQSQLVLICDSVRFVSLTAKPEGDPQAPVVVPPGDDAAGEPPF